MVAPVGVAAKMEIIIPTVADTTAIMEAAHITLLNERNKRIADKAGKIIKAEIKSVPTNFIATTMIKAVIIAIKSWYVLTFTPVAFAKSSSNVTENNF